ncbi:VEFS-Box polycomb domain protein [Nitzschia inconspicua]|uniref:VEFS-Box polycomb domain protein n=1 Tax=Nitzschia inconspicua TaxID=303405 RepID=A0A9K3QAA0_9STRA|nr:VEFS-Box polycomb domain protein [Nitzschia inconspicua]
MESRLHRKKQIHILVAVPTPESNNQTNDSTVMTPQNQNQIVTAEDIHDGDTGKRGYVCPFCQWHCHVEPSPITRVDAFIHHLARFHSDTFAFDFSNASTASTNNDNDATITDTQQQQKQQQPEPTPTMISATVRNEHYQPGCIKNPQQIFLHSRSNIPFAQGQYDRDSDAESTYSWDLAVRQQDLERFDGEQWTTPGEATLFSLWNTFVLRYIHRPEHERRRRRRRRQDQPPQTALNQANDQGSSNQWKPEWCIRFLRQHKRQLRGLEREVYLLFIRLWECRKISGRQFQRLVHLHELEIVGKGGTKRDKKQKGTGKG